MTIENDKIIMISAIHAINRLQIQHTLMYNVVHILTNSKKDSVAHLPTILMCNCKTKIVSYVIS